MQRGCNGMLAHVQRERLVWFERTDTAAQSTLDGKRYEGSAVSLQAGGKRLKRESAINGFFAVIFDWRG